MKLTVNYRNRAQTWGAFLLFIPLARARGGAGAAAGGRAAMTSVALRSAREAAPGELPGRRRRLPDRRGMVMGLGRVLALNVPAEHVGDLNPLAQ